MSFVLCLCATPDVLKLVCADGALSSGRAASKLQNEETQLCVVDVSYHILSKVVANYSNQQPLLQYFGDLAGGHLAPAHCHFSPLED